MLFWMLLIFCVVVHADEHHPHLKTIPAINEEELNPEFWNKMAMETIKQKLAAELNMNQAKNIIFFIGDGMGFPTVAATRMFVDAEQTYLSFEEFPHVGIVSTYCVNRKVPDSACTSTAYLAGVKGNYGTIGVNSQVPRADCEAIRNKAHHTESIVRWAQKAGKATGFVTTTKVTHATPAGVYANTADRYWETDEHVAAAGCDPNYVDDIATQLMFSPTGRNLNVIMGGGRKILLDRKFTDEEGVPGIRTDGQNFIQAWQDMKLATGKRYEYVWNKTRLNAINYDETEYLMGLFEADHCNYNLDIKRNSLKEEPTLTEMVESAVKVLQKNENGFFLFVEGGRIDTAHHDSFAQHALEETAEMARAVTKVKEMTDESETLIVVSADHSHTLTYAGYPARGSDILGVAEISDLDGLPFPTLSYANGRGYENAYKETGGRKDFSEMDYHDLEFRFPATVPLSTESHGGDHVGVWANGPQSHLFEGTYEQNSIPMLMAYIAKIGPYSGSAFMFTISKTLLAALSMFWLRHLV